MFHRLLSMIALCSLLLVVAATLTVADAAEWRIAQMSGQVFVKQGAVQLASLAPNRVLQSESVIVTKKNGRVQLVRGEQTMIISPNSMIALPGDGLFSTRIIEEIGQVEYDVDHRWTYHFSVETPYLAAVVKGTRFQIHVTRGGASVKVLRGRVEVTYFRTGERVDVLAGQKVSVSAAGGITVDGVGKLQPVRKGQPVNQGKRVKSSLTREARATTSRGVDAGATTSTSLGGLSGATSADGVSSIAGRDTASVSTGDGGASVSVGAGGVSAGVGDGGVSVSAGEDGVTAGIGGVGASVGAVGVSVNAGGTSVQAGRDGISVSVGGLSIGGR